MQILEQTSANQIPVEIGIEQSSRQAIAEGISRVLADTYLLYLKTHFFHWNVTGPLFHSLHTMFEEQYIELRDAVDVIAERIRSLGYFAPGSYAQFTELAAMEETRDVLPAMDMVRELVKGNETVVKTIRSILPTVEAGADESTLDLLVERLRVHEKTAWMLRSIHNEVA